MSHGRMAMKQVSGGKEADGAACTQDATTGSEMTTSSNIVATKNGYSNTCATKAEGISYTTNVTDKIDDVTNKRSKTKYGLNMTRLKEPDVDWASLNFSNHDPPAHLNVMVSESSTSLERIRVRILFGGSFFVFSAIADPGADSNFLPVGYGSLMAKEAMSRALDFRQILGIFNGSCQRDMAYRYGSGRPVRAFFRLRIKDFAVRTGSRVCQHRVASEFVVSDVCYPIIGMETLKRSGIMPEDWPTIKYKPSLGDQTVSTYDISSDHDPWDDLGLYPNTKALEPVGVGCNDPKQVWRSAQMTEHLGKKGKSGLATELESTAGRDVQSWIRQAKVQEQLAKDIAREEVMKSFAVVLPEDFLCAFNAVPDDILFKMNLFWNERMALIPKNQIPWYYGEPETELIIGSEVEHEMEQADRVDRGRSVTAMARRDMNLLTRHCPSERDEEERRQNLTESALSAGKRKFKWTVTNGPKEAGCEPADGELKRQQALPTILEIPSPVIREDELEGVSAPESKSKLEAEEEDLEVKAEAVEADAASDQANVGGKPQQSCIVTLFQRCFSQHSEKV